MTKTSKTNSALATRKEARSQLKASLDKYSPTLFGSNVPRGINPNRLKSMAYAAICDNEDLLKCSPESLFRAVSDASTLGLELGRGPTSNAYIVPFHDKRKGMIATLIIGYKGYLTLAHRSGALSDWDAKCVREGDEFEYELGLNRTLRHVPATDAGRNSRPITHVWWIGWLENGRTVIEVKTAAEIESHKLQHAKGFDRSDSPWKLHTEIMYIKTVIRYAFNRGKIPMAAEDHRLVELITEKGSVIEGEFAVHDDEPPLLGTGDFTEDEAKGEVTP